MILLCDHADSSANLNEKKMWMPAATNGDDADDIVVGGDNAGTVVKSGKCVVAGSMWSRFKNFFVKHKKMV